MDMRDQTTVKQRGKSLRRFLFNNLLLMVGFITIVSGLTLQLEFHIGGSRMVCGINQTGWSTIHKIAIILFTLLMIEHYIAHFKWYKNVISKQLVGKNIQVIVLSILFLIVAITGYIPWLINLSGGASIVRLFFIEIHDKVALILVIYLFLHLIKRGKWFMTTYVKLKKT